MPINVSSASTIIYIGGVPIYKDTNTMNRPQMPECESVNIVVRWLPVAYLGLSGMIFISQEVTTLYIIYNVAASLFVLS